VLLPHLNERQRRLAAATEARLLGHGGVRAVARAAGMSETTVRRGVYELEAGEDPLPRGRARRTGGGRKSAEDLDAKLVPSLLALVEPDERGDPMSPLRWTTKSLRNLAEELTRQGHVVSAPTVGRLLREQGFSLQANVKTLEGKQHPNRDAQFRYINEQARTHQSDGQPVISVDAKKKEQLGQLPNTGRQWRPAGEPVEVEDHSFFTVGPDAPQAIPYGIYDIAANSGWVNVGVDHDTATFAVASIRRWWEARGHLDYPGADRLLITADAGGSNSYRFRMWKSELAVLAADTGLSITVCHFPPGTSKWNKIEHRLFSHITMNWRGRPLTSHEVVVNSIAATSTRTGLRVEAALDTGTYPTGVTVSREHVTALPIEPHSTHGVWNYTIHPADGAGAAALIRADDQVIARRQALAMLADPLVTGMTEQEFGELAALLAPGQATSKERRNYLRRGGLRQRPPSTYGRPLLTDAERVLVTVAFLRKVCLQKCLVELLGISGVSISHIISDTRLLLANNKITFTPDTPCFSHAQDFRDWITLQRTEPGRSDLAEVLSDPVLTGMPRADLRAMIQNLAVPYAARLEERWRHQRGDRDRTFEARGVGVFRQSVCDADRFLVAVLYQRGLCGRKTLADLFGVTRRTIRNITEDIAPLLDQHGYTIEPAGVRFTTATAMLASVTSPETPGPPPEQAAKPAP
jgi:transposase